MRASVIVSVAVFLVSCASKAADNAACWDDPTRLEISCTPLTEKLLTSLRFASRQRAIKAMKAEGRPFSRDELHFIGNAKRGDAETGILNLTLRDDRVVTMIRGDSDAESFDNYARTSPGARKRSKSPPT